MQAVEAVRWTGGYSSSLVESGCFVTGVRGGYYWGSSECWSLGKRTEGQVAHGLRCEGIGRRKSLMNWSGSDRPLEWHQI